MIQDIEIKRLTLMKDNPRYISKEQMKKLEKSLTDDPEFLYKRPLLVNEVEGKLIVYAGNQRLRAAKALKLKTIPCIIDRDLSEELMKARAIKDNKTYGEFDFDMLANHFDVEELLSFGFTASELVGDDEEPKAGGNDEKEPEECEKCIACGQKIKK